ncbi:MAG TPA: response regulator transcription factor [Candidatus Onthovicinus excrementipullorum]|nr:response regulator transcription factor [Candidatus Onthovicinus excrementipullorum]
MKRVLVAEDEQAIREFIVINLKSGGYEVQQAENGRQALQIFDDCGGDFDIALLDIMMPEMDGLELCKKLRERSQQLGIIMLSARTQEMDKVTGLLVGADDYITKPFSPSELMARVNSVYRRVDMNRDTVGSSRSEIQLGDFTLNLRNRTLLKGDVPIELTQVEFQIMECFFKNPNAALSRTEILNKVWGSSYFGEEKIVDVNIRRLRVKLEENPSDPKHLITIWGMGYKWIV